MSKEDQASTFSQPATDDDNDLTYYLSGLWKERRLVIGVALFVLAAILAYGFASTPVYESHALLQIHQEDREPASDSTATALLTGPTAPTNGEIQVILSRPLLGEVVETRHLDIVARPNYLPVVGEALARLGLAESLIGWAPLLNGYARGNERLELTKFSVPEPLIGQEFTLVAGEQGEYVLVDPDGHRLFDGKTGSLASHQTPQGKITLLIETLEAAPGTEFVVGKQPLALAVDTLRRGLNVSETEIGSGLVTLALSGREPKRLQRTLDAIIDIYVERNLAQRTREAEQTLEVLAQKLPSLKADLETAENRLNEYRSGAGSVDTSLEARDLLAKIATLDERIYDLKVRRDEIRKKYTPAHPGFLQLDGQIKTLQQEKRELQDKLIALPGAEKTEARLARKVDVASELYVDLLNKAQQLRLVKSGTIANVRIIEPPTLAYGPVSPNIPLTFVLGSVLAGLAGAGAGLAKVIFARRIEDPGELERTFAIPVFASIPQSKVRKRLAERPGYDGKQRLTVGSNSHAGEAIRSLRTGLYSRFAPIKNPVLSISGPAPGVGKSFVATNLAVFSAAVGRRVLLIDGDMRKGHINRVFRVPNAPGLSNVLAGRNRIVDGIYRTRNKRVDVMPRGHLPSNPSELLSEGRIEELVKRVRKHYDMVIIDSPPALAVTDPTIIGRAVDVNLLVVRSGKHPVEELEATVNEYRKNGLTVSGFVINACPESTPYYSVGYHYKLGYGQ